MDGVVIRTTGHVAGGKTDKDIAQYAPYISPDTNTWWQYNKETQMFENTGIVPYGLKGEKGDPGDDYILTEEDKEEIIAAIRAVVVVDSDTVNGHTVEADVPEDAVFTDTTYDPATQSSTGLMSAQDKTRLDTLQNDALRKTAQTLSDAEKTQARTNIGAVSSSDVANAVAQVINNSGAYYCKMPDGTLIQWGIAGQYVSANRQDVQVTMPFEFVNTNYMVFANGEYKEDPNNYETTCIVRVDSAQKFTVHLKNTSSNYIRQYQWLAIGRWK